MQSGLLINTKAQNRLILFFCLFAAIRVAVYLSVFPFFNNVDEIMHFDLVMKYSEGDVPKKLESLSPVSASYMSGCNSTEYAFIRDDPHKKDYPLFLQKRDSGEVQKNFRLTKAYWETMINYESGLAPLYYSIAGAWAKLGLVSGLFDSTNCLFLYWIRSLNIVLAALLVLIAYRAALIAFPQNPVMHLCVPMFAAIIPQDSYYSIQNDVLSPICYGLAFIAMLRFIKSDLPGNRVSALAGISIALTVLVKTSNLPLLLLVTITVAWKMCRLFRKESPGLVLKPMFVFLACALVPVFVWFGWNLSTFGDITASTSKINYFLWISKPFNEWLNTSLLTSWGIADFWTELMASFWRGEFVWASRRLSIPAMDVFYWASSLLFILLAVAGFCKNKNIVQKRINRFTLLSFVVLVLFMIVLSLNFSYSGSLYPSVDRPYFASGRLISASLIPFLLLYVYGFDKALSWFKSERLRIAIFAGIAILITVSEFIVNRTVFSSHHNLFAFF